MAKKKSVKKLDSKNSKVGTLAKTKKPIMSQKSALLSVFAVALILLGVSVFFWWTKIVINPERVLSDAIASSLQTTSVTRQVQQDDGSQKIDQTSYISFYAPTITAQTNTELSQKGSQRQETKITTDTIGTNTVDFVRYASVNGAENLPGAENFQNLLGVWAKKEADPAKGEQTSFLNESLFSIVPFGNIDAESRGQLLDLINQKGLYQYKTAERKIENYRPVYAYNLSIKPADLIEVLAKYAEATGAVDPTQFDPDQYANVPPISVDINVDIASRQITQINYGNTSRIEKFSGYNLYRPIDLPENTITIEELQRRLQEGDSGQSS